MISTSIKSLNLLCIVGYLMFMTLAIDSSIVDALVFFVSEENGTAVFTTGAVRTTSLGKPDAGPAGFAAVQFKSLPLSGSGRVETAAMRTSTASQTSSMSITMNAGLAMKNTSGAAMIEASVAAAAGESHEMAAPHEEVIEEANGAASFTADALATTDDDESGEDGEECASGSEDIDGDTPETTVATVNSDNQSPVIDMRPEVKPASAMAPVSVPMVAPAPAAVTPESSAAQAANAPVDGRQLSILEVIRLLPSRPWRYDPGLDRYVVDYNADTRIVMTIRPALQRLVESAFKHYTTKMGAAVIQDPETGAILALTSSEGRNVLSPDSPGFITDNWALKATFPVASIFKIITAAAGIDRQKVVPASRIRIGRKASLELWRAFAKSHNGVFGVVGRAVGKSVLLAYANAFGFNRPFYFDLPVTKSVADIPDSGVKLGESAAGLNREFEVSPMHVSSIVSTVLNRGRMMKPYLVDYIVHKGQVVFRRQPFPLAQPIPSGVATQIYEMMRTTTIHGTGKRGFACYKTCPDLATASGGKTGTLTGTDPHYLFTWFGGFTRTGGRDLALTVLVGQPGFSSVRAASLAGRIAYELYTGKAPGGAANSRIARK
ncbi:MAG TPA: penicillin-binding transpeptidase domain-containing protein [Candidatus Ozemobacteraceae bacterium]|nr:penicillin-binding transpeptidase domain-containing protein [Candidatus Ozemobacteraceae bacterium]HQG27185.1 penicillin-binding transpeptidase domain-containing protein [Candidatus Ozemobacteraceae bacterium]